MSKEKKSKETDKEIIEEYRKTISLLSGHIHAISASLSTNDIWQGKYFASEGRKDIEKFEKKYGK